MTYAGYALWAVAAGALIPVMAGLNGALGRTLGSTPAAAVVLFAIGFAASALVLVLTGGASALGNITQAPPRLFLGGVIVAFYIICVTCLAPRFGVANTILFVMVAQVFTSSAIDHFGAFGAAARPVGSARVVGLFILLAGLATTQLSSTKS